MNHKQYTGSDLPKVVVFLSLLLSPFHPLMRRNTPPPVTNFDTHKYRDRGLQLNCENRLKIPIDRDQFNYQNESGGSY